MRGPNWRLRICKFSLVGALGIGVQLTVLGVLITAHETFRTWCHNSPSPARIRPCAIAHQYQRALRERNIEQGCRCCQRKSEPDLRS